MIKQDVSGNQSVITQIFPGDLFAETFVCAEISVSPVSVIAPQITPLYS
ncbi:MAG: hypothetical protein KFW09_02150 [Oscillospiraceae bacterium]|nr:hypothetical protein [Oscillospiraceae bacterium]